MPVRLTPQPGEAIPPKRVTKDDWIADPADPLHEYIEILVFLRQDVLDAARKAGTRTIREHGGIREELNTKAYFPALFEAQVKGWRLLDQDGNEIPFNQETLNRLPWDVQGWLHGEILNCGGSIATRDLVVPVEGTDKILTFRETDAGLGTGTV